VTPGPGDATPGAAADPREGSGRTELPTGPGTYVLWLRPVEAGRTLVVGSLGEMELQPGRYAYVGSAMGPGGLRARIGHHRERSPRPHWHVDYLRRDCRPVAVRVAPGTERREHRWADTLAQHPESVVPLEGFGSSDCRCVTHLYHFPGMPSDEETRRALADTGPLATGARGRDGPPALPRRIELEPRG
jgi:Uri superfamily endonuclease